MGRVSRSSASQESQSFNSLMDRADSGSVSPRLRQEVCRLTEENRRLVKDTFQILVDNATNNGLGLFVGLFAEHPEYKDIWMQFRAVPDSALMGSHQLKNHATVYMAGLTKIVGSMDDSDQLCRSTRRIARSHLKWRITKRHIVDMVEPLLFVLQKCLGRKLLREEMNAWATLYDIIGNLIDMQKADKEL